jgi:hypothetical protein
VIDDAEDRPSTPEIGARRILMSVYCLLHKLEWSLAVDAYMSDTDVARRADSALRDAARRHEEQTGCMMMKRLDVTEEFTGGAWVQA